MGSRTGIAVQEKLIDFIVEGGLENKVFLDVGNDEKTRNLELQGTRYMVSKISDLRNKKEIRLIVKYEGKELPISFNGTTISVDIMNHLEDIKVLGRY